MNINDLIRKVKRSPKTTYNIVMPYYVVVFRWFIRLRCRIRRHINVIFLIEFETSCKWDVIYEKMAKMYQFRPLIVASPRADVTEKERIEQQEKCYQYFKQKGYDVIKAYNVEKNKYLDIKTLHPDCIFFTNPYDWIADKRYSIQHLRQYYTYYIPYAYDSIIVNEIYNLPFHKLLWRFYVENDSILQEARNVRNIPDNYCCVGYPSFEKYTERKESNSKKCIIWAPHHTLYPIFGVLNRKSFLQYSDFMLRMAEKYKEKIKFIFRPHPLLRNRLYECEGWGKEKTDAYYAQWDNLENGRYSEVEDYMKEFALSDAIIHDCGSFSIEYLWTLKPMLFLGSNPANDKYNDTAKEAYACCQYAEDENTIEQFINDVILEVSDTLYHKKKLFKEKYLMLSNRQAASLNIINDILEHFQL